MKINKMNWLLVLTAFIPHAIIYSNDVIACYSTRSGEIRQTVKTSQQNEKQACRKLGNEYLPLYQKFGTSAHKKK